MLPATGTRSERGGLIGGFTFDYMPVLVGDYGAGIGLFLFGVAAVLVATNTNPMALYRELERIGRAIYKPLPPIEDTDVFDTIPPSLTNPAKAVSSGVRAPLAPALVINSPKKVSIVKKGRDAVTKVRGRPEAQRRNSRRCPTSRNGTSTIRSRSTRAS